MWLAVLAASVVLSPALAAPPPGPSLALVLCLLAWATATALVRHALALQQHRLQ